MTHLLLLDDNFYTLLLNYYDKLRKNIPNREVKKYFTIFACAH